MFAVVNQAGDVFQGQAEKPAIFETREQAEAVAEWFSGGVYGPLTVQGQQSRETRAAEIMKHAEEHYEEGGWDVIVECWTADDLVAQMVEGMLIENTTSEQDIETLRTGVVAIWADRQADARNSAF